MGNRRKMIVSFLLAARLCSITTGQNAGMCWNCTDPTECSRPVRQACPLNDFPSHCISAQNAMGMIIWRGCDMTNACQAVTNAPNAAQDAITNAVLSGQASCCRIDVAGPLCNDEFVISRGESLKAFFVNIFLLILLK